jgi:uncharacterized RDD family membrane protein YckC
MGAAANVLDRIVDYIVNPAILIVFTAGFFMFVWGIVQFLWTLDEGGKSDGKQHMLWGIVGMLVMVSVYGIIALIDNTFDLDIDNPDMSRINNVTLPANF